MHRTPYLATCALALLALAGTSTAQIQSIRSPERSSIVHELENGALIAVDATGVYGFDSHRDYVLSDFFVRHGLRCGTTRPFPSHEAADGSTSDCSDTFTNPASEYEPQGGATYDIPVVVHILRRKNGAGNISDALVQSQIDVLNEDFRALSGTLGGGGNDVKIQFHLATLDPAGNPTTGITRHKNNTWYQDAGNYASATGWDTTRYLNIYTNLAGGSLGYAFVPSGGGVAGTFFDGVRIYWPAFGRNAPIGAPYNLGRTVTHEVGHYFGLYHTFDGGCASASGCSGNGDLICDTNPESSYTPQGICAKSSCGSPDPSDNYLDYSDDICMAEFTQIQANRMRCTLENFRSSLLQDPNDPPVVTITSPSNGHTVDDGTSITFVGSASDTEDGSLTSSIAWSSNLDGSLGSGGSVSATLSVGTHTITASATDSGGATGNDSISVTVNGTGGGISLSGNIYKVKGKISVDLTWSGAGGAQVDVYRNGSYLTTTTNDGAFTDATGQKGSASFTYQVCETGGGACSNVINVFI